MNKFVYGALVAGLVASTAAFAQTMEADLQQVQNDLNTVTGDIKAINTDSANYLSAYPAVSTLAQANSTLALCKGEATPSAPCATFISAYNAYEAAQTALPAASQVSGWAQTAGELVGNVTQDQSYQNMIGVLALMKTADSTYAALTAAQAAVPVDGATWKGKKRK